MRTLLILLLVAVTAAKPPPEDDPAILLEDSSSILYKDSSSIQFKDSPSILYKNPSSIKYDVSPESRSALGCGTHSLAEGTYTITSPNYPSNYGNNLDCQYRLSAGAGTFSVSCSAFSLEYHYSCSWDWLRVNGVKFCGTAGPTVTHPGTSLDIDFHSDYSVTSSGYSCTITVSSGSPTEELACGSHSLAPGLYSIKSPGFPSTYGNNQDCAYSLTAGSGVNMMALACCTFDIEAHSSCYWDWLRVNGVKYCGRTAPALEQSAGTFSIDFHSDYSVVRGGYYCEVRATP